jgi:2-polyprenyl-3-methyl-5-hydroxy-6-metoxy-1,4-benzoquinol methylase
VTTDVPIDHPRTPVLPPSEVRWKQEAEFFDRWAETVTDDELRIDPLALRRYTRPRLRRRFHKEHRLAVLGDLRGRHLLDVGCGDGSNVVLFAKLGAIVTGVDASAGAIEVARRRARANGVADRVTLVCGPLETVDLPPASFDVIWGDNILHHVLDDLDGVMKRLVMWARSGALCMFYEPLNFNETLRAIRKRIPIETEVTPGERPLVRAEVDLLRRYIPKLAVRPFNLFGRLDAFILTSFNYERSSALRRFAVNATSFLDRVLFALPGVPNLAGSGMLYGRL